MLVRTTNGKLVNIVRNDNGVLWDATGLGWFRRGDLDTPGHAAFSSTTPTGIRVDIQFTKDELVRICKGNRAIQTPISVEELRDATREFTAEAITLAAGKPNQWFREVLNKAEETYQNPVSLMGHLLTDELERNRPEEVAPVAPVARREPTRAKRAPRAKLQPGGYEDTFEGKRILLTPKQVEFLERLDENETWEQDGSNKWYYGDHYTECLSDTMSPMSVGAMITTLREKGAIVTEYVRIEGRRVCKFRLTELGVHIYSKLCSGVVTGGIEDGK